jgi:hypothetical protein
VNEETGNEADWIGTPSSCDSLFRSRLGRANFILDNLIAGGSCKPMIVVMAYGYARRAGQPAPDLTGKPFGSPEVMKAMQDMAAAFEDDVTQARGHPEAARVAHGGGHPARLLRVPRHGPRVAGLAP